MHIIFDGAFFSTLYTVNTIVGLSFLFW